jgi:hypothetical protein
VDHLQMAPAASAAELPLMRTFFCSPKPETRSWGALGCCSHGIINSDYMMVIIVVI